MPSRTQSKKGGPLIVNLSGTPKEIGLQHGRLLSQKIRSQISIYASMFQFTSHLSWPEVRILAHEYAHTIEKLTPGIYSEISGIAEGADLDVLDVVALNCRSEIALGCWTDGCTSLGWKIRGGEGEREEETILAQNWDWTKRVKENLVFMRIEPVHGPRIWMVTEAGIVGKIGFNSHSVATTLNAIRAKPTDASKLPIHIALRVCLNSTSASAAISALEDLGGLASSAHILLADTLGPRSLELSPVGNVYIKPNERGWVCHTNHFIVNRNVYEPPWLDGSAARLERIGELVEEIDSGGNLKAVTGNVLREKVFSDGFNKPQAICCQEDARRPVEVRSETLFCIIMRLREGAEPYAEVVWGRPGSGEESEVLNMPW